MRKILTTNMRIDTDSPFQAQEYTAAALPHLNVKEISEMWKYLCFFQAGAPAAVLGETASTPPHSSVGL